MRKLLFISLLFSPTLLFAQQAWEPGAFSCVAGENGENVWQGTAGQPLDGTASGGSLLYGNTEIASSLSEAYPCYRYNAQPLFRHDGTWGVATIGSHGKTRQCG